MLILRELLALGRQVAPGSDNAEDRTDDDSHYNNSGLSVIGVVSPNVVHLTPLLGTTHSSQV